MNGRTVVIAIVAVLTTARTIVADPSRWCA